MGRNVATTEGAVVYENELFQLLEYKPLTHQGVRTALLLVPPCINKFYIPDLQPDNSFIRYAVGRAPHLCGELAQSARRLAHKTWDDYVEDGAMAGHRRGAEHHRADQINALGFCVGGTILNSNALAVMAARGREPVASATFLTTLIDFADTGILDVFIDEAFVQFRELQMGKGGLMKGQDLASDLQLLAPQRPGVELRGGQLPQGRNAAPFDLLYWNSDSTNLPGPFYAWYLRNFYLKTTWCSPASSPSVARSWTWASSPCPCTSTARAKTTSCPSTPLTRPPRCCLGKSGFVMGPRAISPASSTRRPRTSAATGFAPTASSRHPDQWLEGATEHAGSWWTDWSGHWLKARWQTDCRPKTYGRGRCSRPSSQRLAATLSKRA